jgi:hypothetical protein
MRMNGPAASQQNYLFQLNSRASRQLDRDPKLRARVHQQIADLQEHPERFMATVKPYVAADGLAWRNGDYRYCCRLQRTPEGVVVDILAILHRSEANTARLRRIFR